MVVATRQRGAVGYDTHVEPSAKTKQSSRLWVIGLLAVAIGVAGFVGYQQWQLPKRFATVEEGRLYRSGEVHPHHLRTLRDDYKIKRIISLLNPDAPISATERAACEELGLEYINIEMRGNGDSTPEARQQVLSLLLGEDDTPTLVHCAAGTNRTGLAIGLYRIHKQGWTYEDVLKEMKRYSFDDLPKHEGMREALREAAETKNADRNKE